MNRFTHCALLGTLGLMLLIASSARAADAPTKKIKMLVVTGGHGFRPETFFKLFDDNPEVTYETVAESNDPGNKATPGHGAEVWDREDLGQFDVVLLYDFQRELTAAQQARFLSLFNQGVGLVVLHHALLSYQHWPEYERVAGGKYLLDQEKVGDTVTPSSTYQGDVDIAVTVAAKDHPVTAGLSDFVVRDEIYRGVRTTADITPLLMAEGKALAWARNEKNSRVVGIIIGHGPAHSDANFQRLLAQSIHWVGEPHVASKTN